MGDSEYSALKEAIDTAMRKIKNAKNSIKSAINTAGASMHVHVDETDTFRSYADAIRLMYQRIWSSDDDTDAPQKCIITSADFPLSPQHNSGYIDINDLSAERFGDENKYFAASSFIVNIQNPPVPIIVNNNYFVGKIIGYHDTGVYPEAYDGPLPPDGYKAVVGTSGVPHDIYNSTPERLYGKYIKFCSVVCSNATNGPYAEFPGGLFVSFALGGMGSELNIIADGGNETFKCLGKWDHGTYGIWQRLTGGN